MNLLETKKKVVQARALLAEVADEIAARCASRTCMAEDDLRTLQDEVFMAVRIAETNDSLLFRYGRERFKDKIFAPRIKVVEGENRAKNTIC